MDELQDYLENGNIRNSVNLPNVSMERSGAMRLCIIHKTLPSMLANLTALLSENHIHVENLSNQSRGDYAYTMVDLSSVMPETVVEDVRNLAGVIRVRVLA